MTTKSGRRTATSEQAPAGHGRARLAIAAIVVSLALLAYAMFGASDEDKIMERLRELASAVETKADENLIFRTARLNETFEDALEPNASLSAPELPTTTGTRELAALAGGITRFSQEIRVSVGETDIRVEGNNARAVSAVTLTGLRDGELRRERRHVRFTLHKSGGDWRVASIDVDAQGREDQPEARP